MWILDLFKKRKPTHLIIFINYKNRVTKLYKFLSKITYSVGPKNSLDDIINDVKKFIKKYPYKLNVVNITSYGSGNLLIKTTDSYDKLFDLVNTLKPLLDEKTNIMFTTCFSGISHRKAVEMSEFLNGNNVSAMYGSYSLYGKVVTCSCKQKNYSSDLINNLPKSKNGIDEDEKILVNTFTRDMGEEVSWKTCGMAYEYNKIVTENNICKIGKQPYNLVKCILNYIFNIQK